MIVLWVGRKVVVAVEEWRLALLCCLHSTTPGFHAGVLEACSSAVSRVLGCHTQSNGILPSVSLRPLICLHFHQPIWVLQMGAISHEHTDTQGHCFFIYFDLTMFICLIHTSNIKPVPVNISHSQTQISLRSRHCLPELEHSPLSWARVSAFAYAFVTTNTRTSLKLLLNAANLWMWHEDLPVWRACTIHPVSRFASLLRLIIF